MSAEILMSAGAVDSVVESLWGDMDAYCSFSLCDLSSAVPTGASSYHDGCIGALVGEALSGFRDVVSDDVGVVRGIESSLVRTDERAAALLGRGGGA